MQPSPRTTIESEWVESPNDRPTIPAPAIPIPATSEVRLLVARVPWPAATVDVVVCDLSRDPRSEWFIARAPLQKCMPEEKDKSEGVVVQLSAVRRHSR